jgi:hypothetical protein
MWDVDDEGAKGRREEVEEIVQYLCDTEVGGGFVCRVGEEGSEVEGGCALAYG